MSLKFEIRNPKSEGRPKREFRSLEPSRGSRFRPSGFGFLSDFGFRISAFMGVVLLSSSALAAEHSINLEPAHRSITTNELLQHVTRLASDEFEGRAPGTRGEELTVQYLVEQFRRAGLKPGNPDGTFFQNVPLMGV